MAVEDWSSTASSNTSIDGINIAEGCAPSGLNNAIRAVMANIKTYTAKLYTVAGNDGGLITIQPEGGSLPASPGQNDILIEYVP